MVNLDPVLTGEADKRRPAVIVSNDGANTIAARLGRGVITVAPITSNVRRVYPFQVLLKKHDSGLDVDSKIQVEQVRSVSVERLLERVGTVHIEVMREVDEALRLHLAL